MFTPGRPLPNEAGRRRHTIRAIVIEYTPYTSGWWLFKKEHPGVKVRIDEKDFVRFSQILRNETTTPAGGHTTPTSREVVIGYASFAERDEHAIGDEVELKFSTANQVDQFFTGSPPFRWDGLEKKQASAA